MFTGLVQTIGHVEGVEPSGGKVRLRIQLGELTREIALGDSVMVLGACLTATKIDEGTVFFDVVRETVDRTTLSRLRTGSKVNIELALRLKDRLGGHIVSGHVDGVGRIVSIRKSSAEVRIAIDAPTDVMRFLVEKGSVAVDGISLTIAALSARGFEVAVIPHTLDATTLKEARTGDRVNLEGDLIGKWVAKILGGAGTHKSGDLLEILRKGGYTHQ